MKETNLSSYRRIPISLSRTRPFLTARNVGTALLSRNPTKFINSSPCLWRFLKVPESSWRFLMVSEGFWRFLKIPKDSQRFPKIPEGSGKLQGNFLECLNLLSWAAHKNFAVLVLISAKCGLWKKYLLYVYKKLLCSFNSFVCNFKGFCTDKVDKLWDSLLDM